MEEENESIEGIYKQVDKKMKDDFVEDFNSLQSNLSDEYEYRVKDKSLSYKKTWLERAMVNIEEHIQKRLNYDDLVKEDTRDANVLLNEVKSHFTTEYRSLFQAKILIQEKKRQGRKKADSKKAIECISKFELPEKKAKFVNILHREYKNVEPNIFNCLIKTLDELDYLKQGLAKKTIKEAFELEIMPKKQSQANFNNDYNLDHTNHKDYRKIKKDILQIEEEVLTS